MANLVLLQPSSLKQKKLISSASNWTKIKYLPNPKSKVQIIDNLLQDIALYIMC